MFDACEKQPKLVTSVQLPFHKKRFCTVFVFLDATGKVMDCFGKETFEPGPHYDWALAYMLKALKYLKQIPRKK